MIIEPAIIFLAISIIVLMTVVSILVREISRKIIALFLIYMISKHSDIITITQVPSLTLTGDYALYDVGLLMQKIGIRWIVRSKNELTGQLVFGIRHAERGYCISLTEKEKEKINNLTSEQFVLMKLTR